MRAFDAAYRLGGEEFLILIPGSSDRGAAEIAETLRATIAGHPYAGREVTMSFGVSASLPGEDFDYEHQFALADAALYAAKDAGRNRVGLAAS